VGIGGLAVALAARPTLENIIGSFMIFIDKPFRVGQRVNVMGQNGTIESIGLRSTKIRLLTGPLTSIPNNKLVNVEVENIGRRPFIRRVFNVTITYDTRPEKIVRAVEILREILSVPEPEKPIGDGGIGKSPEKGNVPIETDKQIPSQVGDTTRDSVEENNAPSHPNEAINEPDYEPRVYFNDLNADSLNIVVFYYYHPPDYWEYLEHANWINLQIMERFNAEGINFAFPTQTLHLAGDEKRPLTVGQRWVSKEESFSPSAILAQAAALGAQAVRTPVSDSVRPVASESTLSNPETGSEMTDAPVEDSLLHGDSEEGEDDER
jgi:MscS family membrane protein